MEAPSIIETDPGKFSLSDFLVGDSKDPLKPPPIFTKWHQAGEWAIELYEPQMTGPAEPRTTLNYGGKSHPVINLAPTIISGSRIILKSSPRPMRR